LNIQAKLGGMSLAFRVFPKFVAALAVLLGMFFQTNTAISAPLLSPMEISYDEKVLYCSVGPVEVSDQVILALNQGTPITFSWEIIIEKINDYWVNDTIGEILVVRQAVPDLISKNLAITDTKSAISRRVHTIDEATAFLSKLNNFPILDRSLLSSGVAYNIRAKLHVHEGKLSDSWWAESLRLGKTVALEDITLP